MGYFLGVSAATTLLPAVLLHVAAVQRIKRRKDSALVLLEALGATTRQLVSLQFKSLSPALVVGSGAGVLCLTALLTWDLYLPFFEHSFRAHDMRLAWQWPTVALTTGILTALVLTPVLLLPRQPKAANRPIERAQKPPILRALLVIAYVIVAAKNSVTLMSMGMESAVTWCFSGFLVALFGMPWVTRFLGVLLGQFLLATGHWRHRAALIISGRQLMGMRSISRAAANLGALICLLALAATWVLATNLTVTEAKNDRDAGGGKFLLLSPRSGAESERLAPDLGDALPAGTDLMAWQATTPIGDTASSDCGLWASSVTLRSLGLTSGTQIPTEELPRSLGTETCQGTTKVRIAAANNVQIAALAKKTSPETQLQFLITSDTISPVIC